MAKQIYKIISFHNGLNNNSDPRDLSDGEMSDCMDVMIDQVGKLRTMGSSEAHEAPARSTTIQPGYGLFYFSHDRVGAAGGGLKTVTNISDPSDNTVGFFYDVPIFLPALSTSSGSGAEADIEIILEAG